MCRLLAPLRCQVFQAGLLSFAAVLGPAHALALPQAAPIIVDDDGGPGVQFTEISDALAAAPDFAVILVRPGQYTGPLTVPRSVRIQADPGVTLSPVAIVRIEHVPSGLPVAIQGFDSARFQVFQCAATVVLEGRLSSRVELVDSCADVRTREIEVASVLSSKVEVVGMPAASSGPFVG